MGLLQLHHAKEQEDNTAQLTRGYNKAVVFTKTAVLYRLWKTERRTKMSKPVNPNVIIGMYLNIGLLALQIFLIFFFVIYYKVRKLKIKKDQIIVIGAFCISEILAITMAKAEFAVMSMRENNILAWIFGLSTAGILALFATGVYDQTHENP